VAARSRRGQRRLGSRRSRPGAARAAGGPAAGPADGGAGGRQFQRHRLARRRLSPDRDVRRRRGGRNRPLVDRAGGPGARVARRRRPRAGCSTARRRPVPDRDPRTEGGAAADRDHVPDAARRTGRSNSRPTSSCLPASRWFARGRRMAPRRPPSGGPTPSGRGQSRSGPGLESSFAGGRRHRR